MSVTVLYGSCRDVIQGIPDNSIDAIVTDPPYDLTGKSGRGGFMGKSWDATGVAFDPATWAEALRVLKPGGHILAFGGTRTWHRIAVAIEDAGFEIRDSIAWMYGQGFPKGGSQMKPAFEPIVMGRKPFAGSMGANQGRYGTGSLQIDACRIGTDGGARRGPEDLLCVRGPANSVLGTGLDLGNAAPRVPGLGRWPANVALDADMAAVLDAQTGILTSGKSDGFVGPYRAEVFGKFARNEIRAETVYGDSGGASRFFHVAEGDSQCGHSGADTGIATGTVTTCNGALAPLADGVFTDVPVDTGTLDSRFLYCAKAPGKERPSYINAAGVKVAHTTVKPLTLMRWLVRLVTPPGGTVLDMFAGSGTTLEAAVLEGFSCIGIESEAEYLPLIQLRLDRAALAVRKAQAS